MLFAARARARVRRRRRRRRSKTKMVVSVYEILGTIGSFFISLSVFAQITKVVKTKSATDISLTWQILYIVGVANLLLYGE